MPLHSFVGVCDNDKRFQDKIIKQSNVQDDVKMHKLPGKNERKVPGLLK